MGRPPRLRRARGNAAHLRPRASGLGPRASGLRPRASGLSRKQHPVRATDDPGMSRDPGRLEAFVLADALVVDVYRMTKSFPSEERFGLQSQIRRGTVSVAVAANLVEGSARTSQRDYLHFVGISIGSASEVRYLLDLSVRLAFVSPQDGANLRDRYSRVIRALQALVSSLSRSPRPEARGPQP